MKTNPRQRLLDLWTAYARYCYGEEQWRWGGRDQSSSINDAEQLLILLYPSTEIESLALDRPDSIRDDVLETLKPLGDERDIPRLLVRQITEYLDRYTDDAGNPIFSSKSYLSALSADETISPEQTEYEVVDAYSMALTFCLAAKGFARSFQRQLTRKDLVDEIDVVCSRLDRRLDASMVGLLRSFSISVMPTGSPAEQALVRTISQGRNTGRTANNALLTRLAPIRAKLRDLTFGLRSVEDELDAGKFFECGWAWGVTNNAPEVDIGSAAEVKQSDGLAEPRPSLYFTVQALDGLIDLFSERTNRLGLLTGQQQVMREALQLRWGLTLEYWSAIALFGDNKLPVEDIPWATTDDQVSEYYSLLAAALVVQRVGNSREPTQEQLLVRLAAISEELAQRGRISRRALNAQDGAVALHHPGLRIPMPGSEKGGPALAWNVVDFAPQLGKTALRAARNSLDWRTRSRLLRVSDDIGEHMQTRRLANGLWDNVAGAFAFETNDSDLPVWGITERVMEMLVSASLFAESPVAPDNSLVETAQAEVAEADHLLSQEQLTAPSDPRSPTQERLREAGLRLQRAEFLVASRPASARSIVEQVLRDLDELAAARQDADRRL
ncbi:SCO2524 family protein [Actinospica robiniae]|uniref:SCO2524 family protein n=1 Tax=Actinospica robiniae TaxID=304901 RepID=UPI0004239354|nr:SCO2524 family protein [Actinospica robiniae]